MTMYPKEFDITKVAPPALVEEIDYSAIVEAFKAALKEKLPAWHGEDADPAMKILEVAAYREMLLRQRINDAAKSVLLPFASTTNLDNLAAFYGEERLSGANALCDVEFTVSDHQVELVIPAGYELTDGTATIRAITMTELRFSTSETTKTVQAEFISPAGMAANGITGALAYAVIPLAFIVTILQKTQAVNGADIETDDAFRRRILLSHTRPSTAGSVAGYRYFAFSADSRLKDVSVVSPNPGDVDVYCLSLEGNGDADQTMIDRVQAMLSADDVRPLSDNVTVQSAEIVEYTIEAKLYLYPRASIDIIAEADARIREKVYELHRPSYDIRRSQIIGILWSEGVQSVDLVYPASDIEIAAHQAAFCTGIIVTLGGFDE